MWGTFMATGIALATIVLIAYAVSEYRGGNGVMGILKIIYVMAIAGFLVGSLAAGIAAFYEEPRSPTYGEPPAAHESPDYYGSPEQKAWQAKWDAKWESHREDLRAHYRNVFAIAYPIGLLFVILGMELNLRLDVLRPGLALGGIAMMIYAIGQEHLSNEIRFIGVAVALAVLIYVGYRTFLQRKPSAQEA